LPSSSSKWESFSSWRGRPFPNLELRAPDRAIAKKRNVVIVDLHCVVMLAGRYLGVHFFGQGIAMHLNGSVVGATRIQSPLEVCTWAAYNGILLVGAVLRTTRR
jgi:hypothetical protein